MPGFTHADTAIAQASTAVATQSVTLSAAVAVGDVVCLDWGSPAPDSDTISDTAGNTWRFPGAAANVNKSAYSIISVAAAGGITITSTGGGAGTRFMVADRFSVSGGRAVFGSGVTHAISGTSGNMGTQSGVPGGELLWGALATGSNNVTFTAGSSNSVAAVVGSQTGNPVGSGFSEYIVSGAGGTESMTWTSSVSLGGHGAWQLFFALAAGVQPRATVPVPRRRPARAFIQFTPVTTTNAAAGPPPAGTVQPRATVPVPRRVPSRGQWRQVTGPAFVFVPAPPQQYRLAPRRTPGRGAWRGTAVPGILGIAPSQQYRTAPRRSLARAYVRFTPVTTVNAAPVAGGGRPVSSDGAESRLIRRYRHMLHRHGLDWEPEVSMMAAPVALEVPPGWPGTWPVPLPAALGPEPVIPPVLPVLPPPRWKPVYIRPPRVVRARHVPRDAMMPIWRKG